MLGVYDVAVEGAGAKYLQEPTDGTYLDLSTNHFVISLLFQQKTAATEIWLAKRSTVTGNGFYIYNNGASAPLVLDTQPVGVAIQSAALTAGSWYFAEVYCAPNVTTQWYVNGVASGSAGNITANMTNTQLFTLLAASNGAFQANGKLAYAAIFTRAAWNSGSPTAEWLAVHKSRFLLAFGGYPFWGGTLPSVYGSTSPAYQTKLESDGTRKIYYIGASAPRFEKTQEYAPTLDTLAGYSTEQSSIATTPTTTAPDGTTTASNVLKEDATAGATHDIYAVKTAVSGTTYCWSAFVKAINRSNVYLFTDANLGASGVKFDLTTGQATTTYGSPVDYGIEAYSNGWYRIWVAALATASATVYPTVYACDASGNAAYNGGNQASLYVWGTFFQANVTEPPVFTPREFTGIVNESASSNQFLNNHSTTAWTAYGGAAVAAIDGPDGTSNAQRISGLTLQQVNSGAYQLTAGHTNNAALALGFWLRKVSTSGVIDIQNNGLGVTKGRWTVDLATLPTGWVYLTRNSPYVVEGAQFVAGVTGASSVCIARYSGADPLTVDVDFVTLPAGAQDYPPNSIVTAAAAATKAVDNHKIPWSADLVGLPVGSVRFRFLAPYWTPTTRHTLLSIDDGTIDNRIEAFIDADTNLCLYSADFSSWGTLLGVTVPTTAVLCPDGVTRTTVTLHETAGGTWHFARLASVGTQSASVARYVYSCYVKPAPGGQSWVWLQISSDGTARSCYFDVTNGVIGTPSGLTSYGMIDAGGGWYRCWISWASEAGKTMLPTVLVTTGNNTLTYSGADIDSLYVWGAQLEVGDYPTEYIPTTAAAVTEAATLKLHTRKASGVGGVIELSSTFCDGKIHECLASWNAAGVSFCCDGEWGSDAAAEIMTTATQISIGQDYAGASNAYPVVPGDFKAFQQALRSFVTQGSAYRYDTVSSGGGGGGGTPDI